MVEMISKPPNILFILTDQQRADTIAALGNPMIKTPALDRLAREGTAFTRCYTASPVCVSARFALITGTPPHQTGVVDNMPIPNGVPSLMERLGAVGYQTHGISKMHFMGDPRRMWGFESRDFSEEGAQGEDDYGTFLADHGYGYVDDPHGVRSEYYYIPQTSQLPESLHHTHWVADKAIDFLKRRDLNRPFFLWTSFIKPHPPFENPVPWNKLYRAAEMAKPFRPEGYARSLTFWNRAQNRYKYRDAGIDDFLLRTMRAAYFASISFIDWNLGRILAALGSAIDNTLVLFTSDHGELLGDYGSFGKRSMLEPSVRVPLIVRHPGHFPAGARCPVVSSLLDLFPTLLATAGDSNPIGHEEGRELSHVVQGAGRRQYVYSQFSQARYGLYLITDGRYKYSYSAADDKEWLFDLATDPGETRNLAGNPAFFRQREKLQQTLVERFQKDKYKAAVDPNGWRHYESVEFPDDPDYGLLYQDSGRTQVLVDRLGEYARSVTVPPHVAEKILLATLLPPD